MNLKFCYALIMVVSLFAASANGAPMAYSVNSDGQDDNTLDSLYLIDLATTGSDQRRGTLFSSAYNYSDTEGLAFAPDGVLWGVDDDSRILFPINTLTGAINFLDVIPVPAFPSGGGNDFGMTFTCENSLYVTSVTTHTLYSIDLLDESVEVIGDLGAGIHISAIAAIGNPTRLYGLGNGLSENDEVDSPNLYSINIETGLATVIGPLGMPDPVDPYNEGGLAFASDGTLWAITDRSKTGETSQIVTIDVDTGAATHVSYTRETGFESLAIAPPTDCRAKADEDEYPRIPTLGPAGLLLAIFTLLFAGMIFLRRRIS